MASLSQRSSQGGGGIGKKVHRKRSTRQDASEDWGFALGSERRKASTNTFLKSPPPPPREEDHDDDEPVEQFDTSTSIAQAVAPLRAMAERVGREVETFAQTLDEFFNDLPTRSNRFDAAFELVLKFRDIANDVVQDMKSRHDRDLREQLRKEWSEQARMSTTSSVFGQLGSSMSASLSAKKAEQVKELRSWQQEADMWDLFRIMLELHPFEADAEQRQQEIDEQLAILGPSHRYTSESDLWQRFILEDKIARERDQIKQWLERTTEHQQSDVSSILEALEAKAGVGKGLWSSGWLHTREKIKGEKRSRPWPDAAASPLPQIKRSDNNEMLVTTLDPDAATRQQHTLEKPDAYFERAIWIACWEMLRRGTSWQEICDWCEERKESWRAVAIGAAVDNHDPTSAASFRHICRVAAQSPGMIDHEAAVFGLLGGDMRSVEKVCRTVDDRLYAYYSSALLKQYDNYLLTACPAQAAPTQWQRNIADSPSNNRDEADSAISDLIARLRTGMATSKEAAQPMKIVQSYLMADEVGSLVHTVGTAISVTAALQGPEDVIFLRDRSVRDNLPTLPETEVALDPQALRMAAHMSIVHRVLSPEYLASLDDDELMVDENVLVAYIQALRAAGKRDVIPMYASRLQRSRMIMVLGRLLHDITTTSEQESMLGLLNAYQLDVQAIVTEQLRWVIGSSIGWEDRQLPLRMLERTEDTKLHPGQRIIVDFLSDERQPYDEEIVGALRWYLQLNRAWKTMFDALAVTLRRCLSKYMTESSRSRQFILTGVSQRPTHMCAYDCRRIALRSSLPAQDLRRTRPIRKSYGPHQRAT
jgi:nuclear pore complex protein Nup107